MTKMIKEKDLKIMFKEFIKLDKITRQAQIQDQKIQYVMEGIFKDELCERITTNRNFEDRILAYYSNAEGHNYKMFKERFLEVLKQVGVKEK